MNNPYLLLTPGPLTTSRSIKETMLQDWCTWDDDYNVDVVQDIRKRLVRISCSTKATQDNYSSVLMQGSGTFVVESAIGSLLPENGKLLVINNGVYGARIKEIAQYLKCNVVNLNSDEISAPSPEQLKQKLAEDPEITHVASVHCETTTGMLNPIEKYARVIKKAKRIFILDAMSSFGGIPIDMAQLGIDVLISSANKCLQGVPGFGFVIAKRTLLQQSKPNARSLSLDLYAQWNTMENENGKWRFTSPTHVVRAFQQALNEFEQEGGVRARYLRYKANHNLLVKGMRSLGFETLLNDQQQSPIITTFIEPKAKDYSFKKFYQHLKKQGFVIYPGKVTDRPCFRIGTIGDIQPSNIQALLDAVVLAKYWD